MQVIWLILVVTLISLPHSINGNESYKEEENKIYFKSGFVVDSSIPTNFINSLKNKRDSTKSLQVIVSLYPGNLIDPILKVCSTKTSINLSAGSYSLLCPINQIITLESHPSVKWIAKYDNSFKADIISKRNDVVEEEEGGEYEIYDVIWAEEIEKEKSTSILEESLSKYNINYKITETYMRYSAVSVHKSHVNTFLEAVIQIEIVHRVERRYPTVLYNSKAKAITQTGTLSNDLFDKGLNGDGVIVGISDSGIDTNHCFFYDPLFPVNHCNSTTPTEECLSTNGHRKIVGYYDYSDSNDLNGHGTHVAGTAAGKAFVNSNDTMNQNQGIAPNSKIAFFDVGVGSSTFLSIPSMSEFILAYLSKKGSSVSSHSWGTSSTSYTIVAYLTDIFVYYNPGHLVLHAAGNYGSSIRTLSGNASHKNGIAVGSTLNNISTTISSFSSRGPTSDNRIKPDFVTPGQGILSAKAGSESEGRNCNNPTQQLISYSGTSMATPNAAGAAALVYQYYRQGFICGKNATRCGFNPSAALVKATLINSAQHFNVFDDETLNIAATGFGRLQLNDTLDFTGNKLIFFDRKKLRSSQNFTTTVTPKGRGSLNVVLTWTDPPGSMSTVKALINDLDLIVISPSGIWYYGNVYLGLPYITGRDTINNVERIIIQFFENGPYQIVVRANDLNTFDQSFSLVINLDSNVKYNLKINGIRLADGKSQREGRLELMVGSVWHKACKSLVNVSARTICENFLGFPKSNQHFTYSHRVHPIGSSNGFFQGTFSCLGNETNSKQCSTSPAKCDSQEIIGIYCDCPDGYNWNGKTCDIIMRCDRLEKFENHTFVNIYDNMWANVSVEVPYDFIYDTITVQTFIEHTFTRDLRIFLRHPNGLNLISLHKGGSSEHVFNGTIWSNSALYTPSNVSFTTGKVIETLRPEYPFPDAPNIVSTYGEWGLAIYDSASGDSGKIRGFIITFYYNCNSSLSFVACNTSAYYAPSCATDFDECSLSPCPSYLTCVNTIGSYKCENIFHQQMLTYSPVFYYTFDTSIIMDSSNKSNHLQIKNTNKNNTLSVFPSSLNPKNKAIKLVVPPLVTSKMICHGKSFSFLTSFFSSQPITSKRLVSLSRIFPNGTEKSIVSLTFSSHNISYINVLNSNNIKLGTTSNLFSLNTNHHLMFIYSHIESSIYILVNGNMTLNITVPAILKPGDCFYVSIGRGMTNTLIDYASFHQNSLFSKASQIFANYSANL